MDCELFRQLVPKGDDLTRAEAVAVAYHSVVCADCKAIAEQLSAVDRAYRSSISPRRRKRLERYRLRKTERVFLDPETHEQMREVLRLWMEGRQPR